MINSRQIKITEKSQYCRKTNERKREKERENQN